MKLLSAIMSVLGAILVAGGSAAHAHEMPNSVVYLDFGSQALGMELVLPATELRYALPDETAQRLDHPTRADSAVLAAYILDHLAVTTSDKRSWRLEILTLSPSTQAGHTDVRVELLATPPPGAALDHLILRDSLVTHSVMSHTILVFARRGAGGEGTDAPRLIGALQNPVSDLSVDRPTNTSGGIAPAFRLGARHIAEGVDHLLFLITLMLTAPLAPREGRWCERRSIGGAVRHMALIASAFTLGHSLTLILSAGLNLQLPQAPVEIAIAVSIGVAALQAWRPLFGAREAWVACGFGLIHGLAFAAVVATRLDTPLERAWTILGFNLGVEAAQLVVVVFVAPLLVVLSRTSAYGGGRKIAATMSVTLACGWALQRVLGVETGLEAFVQTAAHLWPVVLVTGVLAIVLTLLRGAFSESARP